MMKLYCAPIRNLSGSATVYALLEYAYKKDFYGSFPKIEKTPNGKPYFPDKPDVHFSLSHAKTHVLCAISVNPVGADIESERHVSKRALRFFATQKELELFDPLDLWVLKESYIKLIGGVLIMVKNIHFSCEEGIISAPDNETISRLYRIDGCRAAISSHGTPPPKSIDLVT